MKITINSYDDLTANQVVELMFRISLANGYHQQNVAEAFYNLGEELTKDQYNG